MPSMRHFLTVYGSQRGVLNRPQFSHTYATFTERQYDDDGAFLGERPLTISWLPDDEDINPLGGPEPGRNYSYDQTIQWLNAGSSLMRWASLETEIQQVLFESAEKRCAAFESGALQYDMLDGDERPDIASNCIHAVMDLPIVLATLGMHGTGMLRGIDASQYAYEYLSPFFVSRPEPEGLRVRVLEVEPELPPDATVPSEDEATALKKMAEEPIGLLKR